MSEKKSVPAALNDFFKNDPVARQWAEERLINPALQECSWVTTAKHIYAEKQAEKKAKKRTMKTANKQRRSGG